MTYELNHVSVSRGNQPVLHDINLKLPRERLVGLVGPNGAGKSTLLSVMAGDLKPEAGQLLLDRAGMQVHAPADLAKQRAIMTQQSAAIFNLTVRQVLELGVIRLCALARATKGPLAHGCSQIRGCGALA